MDTLLWGLCRQHRRRFGGLAHSGSNSAPHTAKARTGSVYRRGCFDGNDCAVQLPWSQEHLLQADTRRRRREIAFRNTGRLSSGYQALSVGIRETEAMAGPECINLNQDRATGRQLMRALIVTPVFGISIPRLCPTSISTTGNLLASNSRYCSG